MPIRCVLDFPQEGGGGRLRREFTEPRHVLTARDVSEVPDVLKRVEAYAKDGLWAAGMVAYEAASAFDAAFPVMASPVDLPLAAFAVFGNEVPSPQPLSPSSRGEGLDRSGVESSSSHSDGGSPSPLLEGERGWGEGGLPAFTCSPWRDTTSRAEFMAKVDSIREDIAAGRYYQTNLTTRLTADFSGDAEALFNALCAAQPDAYALYADFGEWQIASVSPELFFAWDAATGKLTARPMKGTAPSGTAVEKLRESAKDRAENLMIVDLLRNDISRIADDVQVPELFAVQTLPTALQMTSTITGSTRAKTSLYDVFAALFPCGSITGAPKIAAMRAIASYENSPRGAYCGALGVVMPGGNATFSVGIRGVTIANGRAVCGIGSGITWDSKPAEEYAEGQVKQRFLWRASAMFDLLESLKLENGEYWLLSRHIARLERSAAHFGFPFDGDSGRRVLAEHPPTGKHCVRLLLSRTGGIKTEILPFPVTPENPAVALAAAPVFSDDEFLRHKTTNRAVYQLHAPKNPDVFDTLLFNEREEITEFTRGNVAVELDGKLFTPQESCGLLPGTLRAEMLANGTITERIILLSDLPRATAIYFLNGLRGVVKIPIEKSGITR